MSNDKPKICSTLDPIIPPGASLVGEPKKYWKNGSTINIRFLNGDSFVQQKVIQYAREWEKYANIKFNFTDQGISDVRIAFKWEGFEGSDSYVGTDATTIPQNKPTMRFGWFDHNTSDAEFKRVILHEFGHMLGFKHEHQNPGFDIPWDIPKVYAHYRTYPNPPWDDGTIKSNVIDKVSKTISNFTQFDPHSIMIYDIPNSLTIGDFEVHPNFELSATDKSFVRTQYPSFALGFRRDIDAAFFSDANKKLYMLKGEEYIRLSFVVGGAGHVDPGYPARISNWPRLPPNFQKDIDAAFFSDANKKLYMLKGNEYIRSTFVVGGGGGMDPGYPKPISNWPRLPPNFQKDIDAALFSDANKKLYMLKGNEYIRSTFVVGDGGGMDPGYPKPISNWPRLPPNFQKDIDAAFFSDANKKLYMLKGNEYIRSTFVVGGGGGMDPGYPKPISSWVDILAPA